mmetsp:Transcript_91802/g.145172  ORF Transcript_91802/g.145172 Transcript_91802/m.145172 type:complete len:88 (-) Transcript_91802:36-299(-)
MQSSIGVEEILKNCHLTAQRYGLRVPVATNCRICLRPFSLEPCNAELSQRCQDQGHVHISRCSSQSQPCLQQRANATTSTLELRQCL